MALPQLTTLGTLGFGRAVSQRPPLEELMEDPGVLGSITDAGLSGLGWLGETLDKPAAGIRGIVSGLMGGEWGGGALNWLPFSDAMGVTEPTKRVSGRDLTDLAGITSPNIEGFDWDDLPADVGGFAAEVALDPLTYLTFGASALGKAGKVAKAAGLFEKTRRGFGGLGPRASRLTHTLSDLIETGDDLTRAATAAAKQGVDLPSVLNEPLGGLAKFGLPFTDTGVVLGTGDTAKRIAGALDTGADWLKGTAPVRGARALFDPSVMGQLQPEAQKLAEEVYHAKPDIHRRWNKAALDAADEIDQVHKDFHAAFGGNIEANLRTGDMPFDEGSVMAASRRALDDVINWTGENVGRPDAVGSVQAGVQRFIDPSAAIDPALAGRIESVTQGVKEANRTAYEAFLAKGGKGDILENVHMARFIDPSNLHPGQSARVAPTSFGGAMARSEEIRTVPKHVVDELLTDETLRITDQQAVADAIELNYGKFLDPSYEGGIEGHAKALANWVRSHGKGKLGWKTMQDSFADYQRGVHTADRMLEAIHQTVSRSITDDLSGPTVTVRDAFKLAGSIDPDQAVIWQAKKLGRDAGEVADLRIPTRVANAITSVYEKFNSPQWEKAIVGNIRKFTEWFKRSVLFPFPSYLSRNFTSGQGVNALSGDIQTLGDLGGYASAFKTANAYRKSGIPSDLARELVMENVLQKHLGFEGVQVPSYALGPGIAPQKVSEVGKTLEGARRFVDERPLLIDKAPGVKAGRVAWNTIVGTGAKANQHVEFMNRVPMYLYLKGKGYSPAEAARRVRELHFDYQDVTPFEREYATALAPFYIFTRKVVPLVFRTLAEKPGGALAQMIRAQTSLTSDDPMLPEHVSSTLSIPLGERPDGSKSFLTGFGLAHEVPGQFLGGGVQGGLLEAASQLNPLVKAPLEWAAGQSFFQRGPGGAGRPLESLDPTIGRTMSNLAGLGEPIDTPRALEFIAANTPLTRLLSTGRQLSDVERKGVLNTALNVGTGIKITDISPQQQDYTLKSRAAEASKALGAKSFTSTRFSKEQIANARTPEEADAMKRLNAIGAAVAKRNKEREKAATK